LIEPLAPSGGVVVVGASAAGLAVVETLRREGFAGRLTLVGAEPCAPYDRPPLSKHVLAGTLAAEATQLRDERELAALDLDLRLGAAARGLDLTARAVVLEGGEEIPFDALVIATGARPRRLGAGHELAGVHVLRTRGDAAALREALAAASSLAVIGAGVLGCEVAAAARGLGLEVALVDPLPQPLTRALGEPGGRLVADLQRRHGVDLRSGVGVSRLCGEAGRFSAVELDDGMALAADVAVVAIGAEPATDWLAGSGLELADGVVCDATCRAAPDVYAAGDVARWHHPYLGTTIRLEHRTNATEQGRRVARNLLGDVRPYAPAPYFWTDQHGVKIQAVGTFPEDGELAVLAGDLGEDRFVAEYVAEGRVAGVLAWNMPGELGAHRRDLNRAYASPATPEEVEKKPSLV